MKVDSIVLLESLFVPPYRSRLSPIVNSLLTKKLPECKQLINEQLQELQTKENLVLDLDFADYAMLILIHSKTILNRIQVFKNLANVKNTM